MSTSIRLKNSSALVGGKAKVPVPTDLAQGELAVNTNKDDPSLFVKDSEGVVRKIAGSDATGVEGEYLSLATDAGDQTVASTGTTDFAGDVTLGTDKITLDNSGSANFAGVVTGTQMFLNADDLGSNLILVNTANGTDKNVSMSLRAGNNLNKGGISAGVWDNNLVAGYLAFQTSLENTLNTRALITAGGDFRINPNGFTPSSDAAIDLKADGSAEFAATVSAGSSNNTSYAFYGSNNSSTVATINAVSTTSTGQVWSSGWWDVDHLEETLSFSADGAVRSVNTANFDRTISAGNSANTSYGVYASNNSSTVPTIAAVSTISTGQTWSGGWWDVDHLEETSKIKADGSASFAGDVVRGNYGLNQTYAALRSGQIEIGKVTDDLNSTAFISRRYSADSSADEERIKFTTGGSATFAGNVLSGNGLTGTATRGTQITSNGGLRIYPDNQQNIIIVYPEGNTDNKLMLLDRGGNLSCAGNIEANQNIARSVLIQTEPDNDDNYTVTTEEYEEQEELTPYVPAVDPVIGPLGNVLVEGTPAVEATYQTVTKTREIRTYTGPTLDVKAVIQDLQQRVNDRDAVIADLTTRIAALEAA